MATSITDPVGRRVTYYERWHRHAKAAVGPLAVEEAKRLDAAGEPYAVVLSDQDRPVCFVEVSEDCYGVSFLDRLQREHLMYSFEDVGDGKLFLSEAVYREFEGDSDTVAKATIYRFSTDGRVQIEKGEKPFQQAAVTDGHTDVSRNWEPKPGFGDFTGLARKDR
jgi:hypothetical protein